jgi:hypothetical protein
VLDYTIVNGGQPNFTFHSDTTYYVSGGLYLYGVTTFEEDAVIKMLNYCMTIDENGSIDCQTSPYHPAIFTSANDDSVGETITNSTGSPSDWDVGIFLQINTNNASLHDLRFSYGDTAIDQEYGDSQIGITNCQFFDVDYVVNGWNVELYNVLISAPNAGDQLISFYGNLVGVNVTADGATVFVTGIGTAALTNCLITCPQVSAYCTLITNATVWLPRPTNQVYQDAGAGSYYLVGNSPYRDIGTMDIDPVVLAQIQQTTTYAPEEGCWPDTNAPDLGYHYPVNVDSDHDDLPDWWEWKYFGNLSQASDDDYDGDGVNNLYEYLWETDPNKISFTVQLGNQHFNVTNASGNFLALRGQPGYAAVLVNGTNFNDAVWSSYDGIIRINLGPTDGVYQVWFGLKGRAADSEQTWFGTLVYLDRVAPLLTITNPTNSVMAQPYVQLQGYAAESLQSLVYDVSNAVAVVTNQQGALIGQDFDTNLFVYTTNYFQCYDISLTTNLNLITVRATDLAGNATVTNISVTLDYSTATNPVINIYWPPDNTAVVGDTFTCRGWVDDAVALVSAQIVDTNGTTNIVSGLVERDGKFWLENLPLSAGTNTLTLSATNSAGLLSTTNLIVVKSALNLVIHPLSGDLWLPTATVTGTLDDTNYTVWVNGVKAAREGNNWTAEAVPLPEGGTAVVQARAIPNSNNGGNGTGGSGGGPVTYDNLGNPDPPQDQDREQSADRPQGVKIESAHWTYESSYHAPGSQEGWEDGIVKGNYNLRSGGTVHSVGKFSTNGVVFEIMTTDIQYAPDGAFKSGHASLVDLITPEWSYEEDMEAQGNLSITPEIGALFFPAKLCTDTSWARTSQLKLMLYPEGKGKVGSQGVLRLSSTATEESVNPPYFRAIPVEQITMDGKNLASDGVAWKHYAEDPEDVTPLAGVPMYSFDPVGAGDHKLTWLTECPESTNRTTVGIAEHVKCSVSGDAPVEWSVEGGGSIDAGGTFCAPNTPSASTVIAKIGGPNGEAVSQSFTAIPPGAIIILSHIDRPLMREDSNGTLMGAETIFNLLLTPTNVNFGHAIIREEPVTNIIHWPNTNFVEINVPTHGADPIDCSHTAPDDVKSGEPTAYIYDYSLGNYRDFEFPSSWSDQYRNDSGNWIDFSQRTVIRKFFGGNKQAQIIYNGVPGDPQGPY